jgi:hypothetical protein
MADDRVLSQFSRNRLDGELVPQDVMALLGHRDELLQRTGVELNWQKSWAPWLDTSYLSAADRKNPDIMANVKAIVEVCGLVAFVGAEEDGNYFGYWRGPKKRPIAESPLVCLDNEGQFRLLAGSTFAEAILKAKTWDEKQFRELRRWLRSIGISIEWKTREDATYPDEPDNPSELHTKAYYRHLGKKPPR